MGKAPTSISPGSLLPDVRSRQRVGRGASGTNVGARPRKPSAGQYLFTDLIGDDQVAVAWPCSNLN
jgi:hypothetical protein